MHDDLVLIISNHLGLVPEVKIWVLCLVEIQWNHKGEFSGKVRGQGGDIGPLRISMNMLANVQESYVLYRQRLLTLRQFYVSHSAQLH